MATVEDLLKDSLSLIGAASSADSMTTAEKAQNLRALNNFLDSLRLERLSLEALTLESFALVANDGSYTIGPSGDINTVRPLRIEQAWRRDSNSNEYSVDVSMTEGEYNALADRQTYSGPVERLFYDAQPTQGIIYVYPRSSTTDTLYIKSWKPFTQYAAITDNVTLPPGWSHMITQNMAVLLAPLYEREAPATVIREAELSLTRIKRLNAAIPVMQSAYAGNVSTGTIESGWGW